MDTIQCATAIPCDNLDPKIYRQLYEKFLEEYLAENPMFLCFDSKAKQEEYYKCIDEACASLETIQQDDWRG